jgi:hypothetical protein
MKCLLIMVALLNANGILHASNFDDQETPSPPPTGLHIVFDAITEAAPIVIGGAIVIAGTMTIVGALSAFGDNNNLIQKYL